MIGFTHVTEKQLASRATVAVRPLPCRIDVAGSEVPVAKGGVFYETTPFYGVVPLGRISGYPGMV